MATRRGKGRRPAAAKPEAQAEAGSQTQTIGPDDQAELDLSTPGDDKDPTPPSGGKAPTRGRRFQLFEDGQGDYRIYCIANPEIITKTGVPPGTLLPVPEVPGFESTALAMKFIKNSGNQFQGMQLMVLRGMEILEVKLETNPRVHVHCKPKKQVAGPPVE